MSPVKRSTIVTILIALWLTPSYAADTILSETLDNGLTVLADYRSGTTDKPAVLVLHGFLQTHHFSTVQLIAGELAESGFTVLSPTLSLNISRRKNSLTCDAIHNHTVAQSVEEIAFWVDWLKRKGHSRIILIGHSTGSNQLLSYLQHKPDPAIISLIATAVGPIGNWRYPDERHAQLTEAKTALASKKNELGRYTLSFCRNSYTAPPGGYLSYMQWSAEWLIHAIKTSPVPVMVVLGKSDNWLPPDWPKQLENASVHTIGVPEANHYFSGTVEFDFQSLILKLVEDAASEKA